jgi:hypothetical protein
MVMIPSCLVRFAASVAIAVAAAGCQSEVREADRWDALFEQRDGQGWSGGDGAYSVSLPDDRTLWLFGDSLIGRVRDGNRDDTEYRFGNTIAIQADPPPGADPLDSSSIHFDWGAADSSGWLPSFDETLSDPTLPESLVRARDSGAPIIAWPLHGKVVQNDLLQFNVIVTPSDCATCGILDLQVHGSTLSVISGVDRPYDDWGFESHVGWLPDSRPTQRFVAPGLSADGSSVLWGTYVISDPDDPTALLVYGQRTSSNGKELVVARIGDVHVAADALDFDRWSFWDGRAWSPRPEAARGILADSASEVSVLRVPDASGSGFAVVHGGSGFGVGSVRVALGPSAVGPFTERYVLDLRDCPIEGFDADAPPFVYAIKAHPTLSREDELLVSLVLLPAAQGGLGIPESTRYYVPRFVWLPWDEILEHQHSAPERCDIRTRPV